MLLKKEESCVLVVDVQEKLIKTIYAYQHLLACGDWLLRVAQQLQVPILVSEQYPKGLGPTVTAFKSLVPQAPVMEKVTFSCADTPACMDIIQAAGKSQIVIMGIESHVCVLQTALGLREAGFAVFVVEDCISARDPQNTRLAIQRMAHFGVQIISREMALFEWLGQAGTEQFKAMSKEFLQNPLLMGA